MRRPDVESGAGLRPGAVFAGYRIERVLGVGGMGTVYLAAHPRLPRRVALKLMNPQLTRNDYVRSRFELEAEQAARLEHPNIVDVYDRGSEGDQLWIAMQYVKGTNAGEVVRGGPLAVERALSVIGETAKALDYAHRQGVLHRDVKPDNILLEHDSADRPGRVLLADFGIAKALAGSARLTQTGMVVASLQYAAPEQFRGFVLDERTDVYALGCTLFHLLTGQPPYPGTSLAELMKGHVMAPVPRVSPLNPELGTGWDAVFTRVLAKDRIDRYPNCGALAAEATRAALVRGSNAALPTHSGYLPARAPVRAVGASPRRGPGLPESVRRWVSQLSALTRTRLRPPERWRLRPQLMGVVAALAVIVAVTIGLVIYTAARPSPKAVQTVVPFTSYIDPYGVAVDSGGNVYVTDNGRNRVVRLAVGSTDEQSLPFAELNSPRGVAVDSSGIVSVTDSGNGRVLTLPAGSPTPQVVPFPDLLSPHGVAVDSDGNVYVADTINGRVSEAPVGSGAPFELPFTGLSNPHGVAVDSGGDVYVSDADNNRVVKWSRELRAQQVLPFTGLSSPRGVAVDFHGDVYVADADNNRVVKLPAGSSAQQVLPFTGLSSPRGVAVDPERYVYVVDKGNARVLKLMDG